MSKADNDPDALHEGIDYYWENGCVVFTAHFLTKRGRCCDTGCRHCPYKSKPVEVIVAPAVTEKALERKRAS